MSRPLDFPFTALEIALKARTGRLALSDRLRLATAALAPEVEADGRAAAAAFLDEVGDTAGESAVASAGQGLHAWVSGVYPPPPVSVPEHDWQRRKDLA